ncbi:MAG TPA: phage baseplate assembly protein V [Herpetosiphonaceae bacterium]
MYGTQENGIRIGIVSDLNDPLRLGRVRVTYPTLDDQQSTWARLATLMAGPSRGSVFVPEVEDEVLIAFEEGDPRRPYVIGALWSTVDPPPPTDGQIPQNNWRFFKSRCGHIIKFDDTPGAEKIEILDKDNAHKIIIDSPKQKIQVLCDTGDVEVSAASGTVKVDALNIEMQATQKVTIQAATVEIKATTTMNVEAGAAMTIKGAVVNIN